METMHGTGIPVERATVLAEDAYERLLSEMQALSEDEVLTVNLDITSAVVTVLGVQPALDGLEHQISKMRDLDVDVERILNVGLYARALAQAHSLYVVALEPTDTLKAMTVEGTALRDVLIADAHALARRKCMNTERLKELTGPIGYKNLAFDLQHLANLFRANYAKIQGNSGTKMAEIIRAQEISITILELVGLRERAAARVAEASDIRSRAFTLFLRAYDEARRAVSFLRWHKEDANDITPSLYTGKGRKKDAERSVPAPVAAPDPPAITAPVPAAVTPAALEIGFPHGGPFLS